MGGLISTMRLNNSKGKMIRVEGEQMKIVALGDSITEGYPFSPQESWVEYATRKLKIEIVNQGINGDFTQGMLERFPRDVISYNPTHVIILGGANDAYEGLPLSRVSANFSAMLEICSRYGIIPILGLPTPSLLPSEEKFLAEYRNWLKDYASREKMAVIDFYTPFQRAIQAGGADKLYVDEVHPSIEGYRMMGETAVQRLNAIQPNGKWF